MHMREQWRLHCTSQWGWWQTSLSEHVSCVALEFKITEWNNSSASNFVLSLNIPPQKLCWWFRRLQLWATDDWQLHHNSVPAYASHLLQSFLVKHQILQVTQPPVAQTWCPVTSGFSWNSNHLWKGRDFRLPVRFRETGKAGDWESCVRSQGACFEGDWGVIALCSVSCVLFNKCLFRITRLSIFWTDHAHMHTHTSTSFFLCCYCLGTEEVEGVEVEAVGRITNKVLMCKDVGFLLKWLDCFLWDLACCKLILCLLVF